MDTEHTHLCWSKAGRPSNDLPEQHRLNYHLIDIVPVPDPMHLQSAGGHSVRMKQPDDICDDLLHLKLVGLPF